LDTVDPKERIIREEFAATFPVFRQKGGVLLDKIMTDAAYRAFSENDQI
jgi:hypothetical protein